MARKLIKNYFLKFLTIFFSNTLKKNNLVNNFKNHFRSIFSPFQAISSNFVFFHFLTKFFLTQQVKSVQSQVPVQAVDSSKASLKEKQWQCKLSTNQHSGKNALDQQRYGQKSGVGTKIPLLGQTPFLFEQDFQVTPLT